MASLLLCQSCNTPFLHSSSMPQISGDGPHSSMRARIQERLRCNGDPTECEASHCQAIISFSSTELEGYDAEIVRLKDALRQTELARSAFEEYSALCRSLFAPIRRLPPEILAEIFYWCSSAWYYEDHGWATEEKRVAKWQLLQMSRVCTWWHTLVMGTPKLWSSVDLHLDYWSASQAVRMTDLLRTLLRRGVHTPLDIRVRCSETDTCSSAALQLLAQCAPRWKTARFGTPFKCLQPMLSARGNFPLLEGLHIWGSGQFASEITSMFGVAPRLETVSYIGPPAALAKLPLEQLGFVTYSHVTPQDLVEFLPLMVRLSGVERCLVLQYLWGDESNPYPRIPAVVSGISELALVAVSPVDENAGADNILSYIISCLTLPVLTILDLRIAEFEGIPLPWPHLAFSSLSQRSAFSSHLLCLDLDQVLISETDLVQTLSELRVLEELEIRDYVIVDGTGVDLVLLTNSLLQRLTWTPDPKCLVPALSTLACYTRLQFDDAVLLEFVLSRIRPGRNRYGPFEFNLQSYDGDHREMDYAVTMKLDELKFQQELSFSCRPATGPQYLLSTNHGL
ncbi:hypothetical protein C8R47DRAFT_1123796 [Mycena vitilis]|nr:hypothetical protein C8R47DRAFT_1123796 [Mycena vitilis]